LERAGKVGGGAGSRSPFLKGIALWGARGGEKRWSKKIKKKTTSRALAKGNRKQGGGRLMGASSWRRQTSIGGKKIWEIQYSRGNGCHTQKSICQRKEKKKQNSNNNKTKRDDFKTAFKRYGKDVLCIKTGKILLKRKNRLGREGRRISH